MYFLGSIAIYSYLYTTNILVYNGEWVWGRTKPKKYFVIRSSFMNQSRIYFAYAL